MSARHSRLVQAAATAFKPPDGASSRAVRWAGGKGRVAGKAICAVSLLFVGLTPVGWRRVVAPVAIPWMLVGLILVVVGGTRVVLGSGADSGERRGLRLCVAIGIGICAIVLMAGASVGGSTLIGL